MMKFIPVGSKVAIQYDDGIGVPFHNITQAKKACNIEADWRFSEVRTLRQRALELEQEAKEFRILATYGVVKKEESI